MTAFEVLCMDPRRGTPMLVFTRYTVFFEWGEVTFDNIIVREYIRNDETSVSILLAHVTDPDLVDPEHRGWWFFINDKRQHRFQARQLGDGLEIDCNRLKYDISDRLFPAGNFRQLDGDDSTKVELVDSEGACQLNFTADGETIGIARL